MTSVDGIDVDPALEWAAAQVGSLAEVRQLHGGWTSTMLALRTTRGEHAVLRLMTKEPWRSHGESLTTREHEVQRLLATERVPAPRTIALDAEGVHCHHPAHLMTWLPGRVEMGRVDGPSLGRLARLLHGIHRVEPPDGLRAYQSWAWEAKLVVPGWASDPEAWTEAFALLRGAVPEFEPRFIHRDFQPRNVLWSGEEASGVVDWVETSIGPAWLDVAHCATNIALEHGNDRADAFTAAYADAAAVPPQPFFDVMDVVGFLPPPGRPGFITDAERRRRLEGRLRTVLERL